VPSRFTCTTRSHSSGGHLVEGTAGVDARGGEHPVKPTGTAGQLGHRALGGLAVGQVRQRMLDSALRRDAVEHQRPPAGLPDRLDGGGAEAGRAPGDQHGSQ